MMPRFPKYFAPVFDCRCHAVCRPTSASTRRNPRREESSSLTSRSWCRRCIIPFSGILPQHGLAYSVSNCDLDQQKWQVRAKRIREINIKPLPCLSPQSLACCLPSKKKEITLFLAQSLLKASSLPPCTEYVYLTQLQLTTLHSLHRCYFPL
jgi:hypothetical protein